MPHGLEPRRVRLLSSDEAALERVAGDPTRGASMDPELLRRTDDRVASLLPTMTASEWTFDFVTMSWQAIVDDLAAALLPARP